MCRFWMRSSTRAVLGLHLAATGCSEDRHGGALTSATGIATNTSTSSEPEGSVTSPDSGTSDGRSGTSDGSGTSGSGTSGSVSGSEPSASDMGSSEPGSTSSDGISFDLGGKTDLPGTHEGCRKIDFLFVVDNSGSMQSHQMNLLNSFGPFIDTIASTVAGNDYHIMVVDSDACQHSGWPPPTCFPGCDSVLGAGQVRDCSVPNGIRYLTSELDFPTLKSTFQCIANVGTLGSGAEMPMTAIVEAIGPLNSPGQCNEGFLRDDAILVITVISDDHSGWTAEDNQTGFGGTPQSWYDAVIAAKRSPENVVVLGLYALLSDQSCIMLGPEEADQFIEFTSKFGSQGIIGSVCAPDYNVFFQEAIGLIDHTCEAFVPPEG